MMPFLPHHRFQKNSWIPKRFVFVNDDAERDWEIDEVVEDPDALPPGAELINLKTGKTPSQEAADQEAAKQATADFLKRIKQAADMQRGGVDPEEPIPDKEPPKPLSRPPEQDPAIVRLQQELERYKAGESPVPKPGQGFQTGSATEKLGSRRIEERIQRRRDVIQDELDQAAAEIQNELAQKQRFLELLRRFQDRIQGWQGPAGPYPFGERLEAEVSLYTNWLDNVPQQLARGLKPPLKTPRLQEVEDRLRASQERLQTLRNDILLHAEERAGLTIPERAFDDPTPHHERGRQAESLAAERRSTHQQLERALITETGDPIGDDVQLSRLSRELEQLHVVQQRDAEERILLIALERLATLEDELIIAQEQAAKAKWPGGEPGAEVAMTRSRVVAVEEQIEEQNRALESFFAHPGELSALRELLLEMEKGVREMGASMMAMGVREARAQQAHTEEVARIHADASAQIAAGEQQTRELIARERAEHQRGIAAMQASVEHARGALDAARRGSRTTRERADERIQAAQTAAREALEEAKTQTRRAERAEVDADRGRILDTENLIQELSVLDAEVLTLRELAEDERELVRTLAEARARVQAQQQQLRLEIQQDITQRTPEFVQVITDIQGALQLAEEERDRLTASARSALSGVNDQIQRLQTSMATNAAEIKATRSGRLKQGRQAVQQFRATVLAASRARRDVARAAMDQLRAERPSADPTRQNQIDTELQQHQVTLDEFDQAREQFAQMREQLVEQVNEHLERLEKDIVRGERRLRGLERRKERYEDRIRGYLGRGGQAILDINREIKRLSLALQALSTTGQATPTLVSGSHRPGSILARAQGLQQTLTDCHSAIAGQLDQAAGSNKTQRLIALADEEQELDRRENEELQRLRDQIHTIRTSRATSGQFVPAQLPDRERRDSSGQPIPDTYTPEFREFIFECMLHAVDWNMRLVEQRIADAEALEALLDQRDQENQELADAMEAQNQMYLTQLRQMVRDVDPLRPAIEAIDDGQVSDPSGDKRRRLVALRHTRYPGMPLIDPSAPLDGLDETDLHVLYADTAAAVEQAIRANDVLREDGEALRQAIDSIIVVIDNWVTTSTQALQAYKDTVDDYDTAAAEAYKKRKDISDRQYQIEDLRRKGLDADPETGIPLLNLVSALEAAIQDGQQLQANFEAAEQTLSAARQNVQDTDRLRPRYQQPGHPSLVDILRTVNLSHPTVAPLRDELVGLMHLLERMDGAFELLRQQMQDTLSAHERTIRRNRELQVLVYDHLEQRELAEAELTRAQGRITDLEDADAAAQARIAELEQEIRELSAQVSGAPASPAAAPAGNPELAMLGAILAEELERQGINL